MREETPEKVTRVDGFSYLFSGFFPFIRFSDNTYVKEKKLRKDGLRLVFGDFPVGAFFGNFEMHVVAVFRFGGPVNGEVAGGVIALVGEGELVEGCVADAVFK